MHAGRPTEISSRSNLREGTMISWWWWSWCALEMKEIKFDKSYWCSFSWRLQMKILKQLLHLINDPNAMFTWSCWKYKWKFPMHWEREWTWWQLLTYVLPWRVCVHIPTSWPSPIVWHSTRSNITSFHASSSCASLGESRGRAPLQWSTPPHPNPPGWPGCKYLCHQVLNANWFKLSNTWNMK